MKKLLFPVLLLVGILLYLGSGENEGGPGLPSPEGATGAPTARDPELDFWPAEGVASAPDEAPPAPRRELEPPAAVRGDSDTVLVQATVHDRAGRPLAGVVLECLALEDGPRGVSDEAGELEQEFEHAVLRGLRPQTILFRVGGEAWIPEVERLSCDGPGPCFLGSFVLEPAGSLRGRVVDVTGAPMEGVLIGATDPRIDPAAPLREDEKVFAHSPLGAPTKTDSAGEYHLRGVPPTTCCVLARAPGHFLAWSDPVGVHVGEENRVHDLVLERAGAENLITGQVLDAAGGPRVNHPVSLVTADGNGSLGTTRTDAGGRFVLLVQAGETYRLKAGLTGHDPLYAYDVRAGTKDLVLRPEEKPQFDLIVQDPQGETLGSFSVQLRFEEGSLVPGGSLWNEAPEAVRMDLPERPFRMEIGGPGYRFYESGPLRPDVMENPLRVTLVPRENLFRGRVVSAAGRVGGLEVDGHLEQEEAPISLLLSGLHLRAQAASFHATTDREGRFQLPFQPEAMLGNGVSIVRVHVIGPGEASGYLRSFELSESGPPPEVVVESLPAGSLEGVVQAPPDTELRGLAVAVSQANGHTSVQRLGATGAFHFENLAPGEWQAVVVPARESLGNRDPIVRQLAPSESIPWNFTVLPGETTRFDPVYAPDPGPACTFAGRFLVDGEVPLGWTWNLRIPGGFERGRLDTEGRFEVPVAEPGPCRLHLAPPAEGLCGRAWCTLDLDLAEGTTTWTHDLQTASLRVTGLLPPLDDVEELLDRGMSDSVRVRWEDDSSDLVWEGTLLCSPAEGLTLGHVPAGTLTFQRIANGRPPEGPGTTLELLPGQAGRIDLAEAR